MRDGAAVRVRLHDVDDAGKETTVRDTRDCSQASWRLEKRYAVIVSTRVAIAGLSPRSCCRAVRPRHQELVGARLAWWFRRYAPVTGNLKGLRERLDGHGRDCGGMETAAAQ
jgi:hypothetical protein